MTFRNVPEIRVLTPDTGRAMVAPQPKTQTAKNMPSRNGRSESFLQPSPGQKARSVQGHNPFGRYHRKVLRVPKNDTQQPVAEAEEWEEIRTGLGTEWDFVNGPLVGNYVGTTTQDIEDKRTQETRVVNVYQFAPEDDPSSLVFVWGSSELDAAMADDRIRIGDRMRIIFLGIEQFAGDDGPRQIKRYRVQYSNRPRS